MPSKKHPLAKQDLIYRLKRSVSVEQKQIEHIADYLRDPNSKLSPRQWDTTYRAYIARKDLVKQQEEQIRQLEEE